MEVYIAALTVRLSVDGQSDEETTQYSTMRLLDVGSARLYVGGVGVAHLAAALNAGLDTLLGGPQRANAGSLRAGCVRNFKVDLHLTLLLPPPLIGGGIKQCFCLTSVCLTSVAYIRPKSRTERPRKTKIGTEVAHVTRDSNTTFKVKRSKVKVARPLYSPRP